MANKYDAFLGQLENEGSATPELMDVKPNKYDAFLDGREGGAAATMNHIKEGSVKDYTDAQTLSNDTGLAHDFVFKNPSINGIVKRKKNEAIVKQNPAMQNVFLQDPKQAGVLQEDIERLDNISKSPLFQFGAVNVKINGESKRFTKRPEPTDFPLNGTRGLKQATSELQEAQRQFDQDREFNKYRLSTEEKPTFTQLTSPFKYGFTNWVDRVNDTFDFSLGLKYGLQRAENAGRVSLYELGLTTGLIKQRREAELKSGLPTSLSDPNRSFAMTIARNERDLSKYAPPPDVAQELQNISESEGFGVFVALAQNPRGATEMLLQSAGFYAPSLALGVMTRGRVGRSVAFFSSSVVSNYSNTLVDAIRDNNVDLSDPRAVYDAVSNPELLEVAREYAARYAIPLAIFETISLGIAGRLLPYFGKTRTGVLLGSGAEVTAQATLAAGGEASAQLNVGEYNLTEIILEAVLGVPLNVPEIVLATYEANSEAAKLEAKMRNEAEQAERGAGELSSAAQELVESEAFKEGLAGRSAVEQVLNQSNPAAKVELDVQEYQNIVEELGSPEQNKIQLPRSIQEQLGDAIDVSGTLVIPTSEFLSAFAGTPYYQAMLDHVRLDPGGATLAESAEFKKNPDAAMQAAVSQLQATKDNELGVAQSRQKVRDYVLGDLTSTGRYTPDVADANAQFVASYFNSLGERLGKTPEQAFKDSGLNITGIAPGGQRFDQGPATFTQRQADQSYNVTGEFNKPVNLPIESIAIPTDQTLVSPEAIEFARENFNEIRDQPITMDISGDGTVTISEGLERAIVAKERGESVIPAEIRYFDDAQNAETGFTPDEVIAIDAQQVNTNAYFQSDLIGKDVKRVLRREPTNLTAEEQIVFDRYLDSRDDKQLILDRLKTHAGTPWAKQAVEGVFTREAMLMLMRGEEPNVQSSLDSKQVAKLRSSLERGSEGMWSYLEATGGMMGHASKPVNNVNSSFINCNPSKDCAQYCYATQGNYRYANVLVKSEMITMAIELDPVRAANVVAREYKATAEYANKKALRLFDKGDGDAKWLPFIEALNNQDVRVQIFSKQPEFLRAVSDKNLRLLSIDESNKAMADQNPDLSVAFVYSGTHQIADLATMVERGQIQVVLPVKLGRKVLDGSEVKDLKTSVKGIGKYICPIDAGYKKIAKTSDPSGWNCTKCDKNGGLGCFFGKVTKAVRLSDEVKPVSSQEKAKRILELKRSINELNAQTSQDMAEPGSVYSGRSEGLLREVDALLGDLLRDYVPATEDNPAYNIGSGIGGPEFGTGESIRDNGGTSTDGDNIPKRNVIPIKSYKQGGDGNRGFYSPDTSTITLLESADLTTFLHESGHFFYENNIRVASELVNQETLNESEQTFIDDVSALLRWNGMQGTPKEQLNWWFSLEFEEKRQYHEQVAESFEKYLFSGKAPSAELQPLFQRFAGWLANVYKSIKEFTLLYPRAKTLNPEIRAVFDRMLATTEEINFAEQSRSMQPLFDSPEQASMTPDEYKRYINTALDSSAQAQEQLRAKGLRDMQWLSNAKTKEIKRLQRDSREIRNEIRMEERGKVLSQPVYRAWTFLTNRLDNESKARVGGFTLPKSKKGPVDPAIDTLLVAIAKLGGLNKDQLIGAWGLDPKDRSPTPLFGTPTYRKTGGRTIDDMAMLLAEEGYIKTDENNQYDLAEFEVMFMESVNGTQDHYSSFVTPELLLARPGEGIKDFETLGAGRFDIDGTLEVVGLEGTDRLKAMGMTRKDAIHPDIVADQFGFDSGQALIAALTAVDKPQLAIESRVDQRMIAEYAELGSDEAIARSADEAIHSEARARFITTELNALKRQLSSGDKRKVSYDMAKQYANEQVGRTIIRNISAQKFSYAGRRAAKRATESLMKGDTQQAATEKRNQLLAITLARKSHEARGEVDKGLRYLRKFSKDGTRKAIDVDYRDQIDQVLERFDLIARTNKSIDRRKGLGSWLNAQLERGILPEIPLETFLTPDQIRRYDARIQEEASGQIEGGVAFTDHERVAILKTFLNEPIKQNYKEITLTDFQGLIDTVKTIEHMGRWKNRLLLDAQKREFKEIESEMTNSIYSNTGDQQILNREPADQKERWFKTVKNYGSGHIKVASWARIFDGGENGPIWEHVVRPANDRADFEARRRAQSTEELTKIMDPLFGGPKLEGKRTFFKSINRSFTRGQVLAISLNRGNEGNLQRLLDGENWSLEQMQPVFESLTKDEWLSVQGVWDFMDSFRPEIAAKERMLTGKEPDWVEAIPFTTRTADGQEVNLAGGYYPVVYDIEASRRASSYAEAEEIAQQLRGAYTSATTKHSFTKARADKVVGRPLRYSLDAAFNGVNDVIHDLAWSPFLVDVNRIMRSDMIDKAIRDKYGSEPIKEIKSWIQAIADGEGTKKNWDGGMFRHNVTAAGLGYSFSTAGLQVIGFNQSIVRVGTRWIGKGLVNYIANPFALTRDVKEASSFMELRTRTRFREIAELSAEVRGQSKIKTKYLGGVYLFMTRMQMLVDVVTWKGGYERAMFEGNDNARSIALADQGVIDSQGGGQLKDLSRFEREHKMFTVFYSYMNTALNLGYVEAKTEKSKAKLMAKLLMIYMVGSVAGTVFKDAITPGDATDEDDMKGLAKRLAADQISYMMGLFVGVREVSALADIVTGSRYFDYSGPIALRIVGDTIRFSAQARQLEFDKAFLKSSVNLMGSLFGIPSVQINKTINGIDALADGKTDNPWAVFLGYQEP